MTQSEIQQISSSHRTPFYLYDMDVLDKTISELKKTVSVNPKFRIHYAMKACYESLVLHKIQRAGFGIDAVSGGEILKAIDHGFKPSQIIFAGVGKTDEEINLALDLQIGCFNVESLPELEVISQLASQKGVKARIALRVNPEIDAHTHHYITTGLAENKFGINLCQLDEAIAKTLSSPNIDLVGLHFHIGSQITIVEPFVLLCQKINAIVAQLFERGINLESIDLGGGFGIEYDDTSKNEIAQLSDFFSTINRYLDTSHIQEVIFEPGRAIVGVCGHLISRILFVKEGVKRTFVILDAGMTELIRPALYGARHPIRNITGDLRKDAPQQVDIVGPVCESSDCFGCDYIIANPKRGDIVSI